MSFKAQTRTFCAHRALQFTQQPIKFILSLPAQTAKVAATRLWGPTEHLEGSTVTHWWAGSNLESAARDTLGTVNPKIKGNHGLREQDLQKMKPISSLCSTPHYTLGPFLQHGCSGQRQRPLQVRFLCFFMSHVHTLRGSGCMPCTQPSSHLLIARGMELGAICMACKFRPFPLWMFRWCHEPDLWPRNLAATRPPHLDYSDLCANMHEMHHSESA